MARLLMAYRLTDFVQQVRDAVERNLPPPELLKNLTPGFERLLSNRSFLWKEVERASPARDEVCLYRDPTHDFVVLARGVSQRGKKKGSSHAVTPHDHGPLWALYGIYEGRARFQRYEPGEADQSERFPGLRLTGDARAKSGEIDAIEPHHMHLPVGDPDTGAVTIVVYNKPLDSVVRRGYIPETQRVVEFRGNYPPLTSSSKLIRPG